MTARRTHNPNGVTTKPVDFHTTGDFPETVIMDTEWSTPEIEFTTCGQCTVLMVKGEDVGGLCPDCDCLWRTGQLCPD